MRLGVVCLASVLLAGCGGSSSGSLSGAFCSDLQDGLTPFQILQPSVADGTYSASEAADLAYGWAAISCPDELRSNEALRTYLQNWNINPDA
jgi:major membrane immunogen (membrane-anchored lipoprotein)